MGIKLLKYLLIVFPFLQVQAQNISIYPTRMFLNGAPGQTIKQQLVISNSGKSPVAFKAYLKDWLRDSTGVKHYFEPGSLPNSNALWIEASPDLVEILPGEQREITVSLHVPNDTSGATVTNSMLFLTQLNEQKGVSQNAGGQKVNINIKLEAGIHVYNTPPGFTLKDIDFISFNEKNKLQTDSARQLILKIKNKGKVVTDAQVRLELTNKQSGEEIKVPFIPVSMLPGAEQLIRFELPPKLKGNFLAVAILDCGPDSNLKVAEKELNYVP